MPKLINGCHEAFALALATGAPLEDAHEDAGLTGALEEARRLACRKDIAARVLELQTEQADLDEARPTAVIISLLRLAREAVALKTADGLREARRALLDAQRLHRGQVREREYAGLTVLDDDEWDAVFRTAGSAERGGTPAMAGH